VVGGCVTIVFIADLGAHVQLVDVANPDVGAVNANFRLVRGAIPGEHHRLVGTCNANVEPSFI
jgi:ribosomal protein L3